MARELSITFPKSIRPWALISRTAPDEVNVTNLEEEIPEHAKANQEVLVALAMRALRQQNWAAAERLAQQATNEDNKWQAPWMILAQAKLQQTIETGYKIADGSLVTHTPSVIQDVIHLFDRAVRIAEDAKSDYFLLNALFERGRAKRFAKDFSGSDDDCAKAYRVNPSSPDALLYYGKHLYQRSNPEAAIPMLREAITLGAGGEAKFLLALALREHDKTDCQKEWITLVQEAAKDPTVSSRWDVISLALEGLLDKKPFSDAEQFINSLVDDGLPDIAADSYWVHVALAQNDKATASSAASSARAKVTDKTDIGLVRLVADAFSRLGDYSSALPLWDQVVTVTKEITDAWRTVTRIKTSQAV